MKNSFLEAGLAAAIFFAANAVYAIDAMIGNSITSVRDPGALTRPSSRNIHVNLSEDGKIRGPSPMSVGVEAAESEYSFCVGPEFGSQPMHITVPGKTFALISESMALPYEFDLTVDGLENGDLIAKACTDEGNVKLKVSIDSSKLALVRSLVFTDTVTLVVDPE